MIVLRINCHTLPVMVKTVSNSIKFLRSPIRKKESRKEGREWKTMGNGNRLDGERIRERVIGE